MSKAKKTIKAKEPVRIRFKALANGNKSIYLDIYQGGGKRHCEFLKLYLIPEIDKESKVRNQETLRIAEGIKSKRYLDIIENGEVRVKRDSKMLLKDWIRIYTEEKIPTMRGTATLNRIKNTENRLYDFKGDGVKLADVDKKYCEDFMKYLSSAKSKKVSAKSKKVGKPLSRNTQVLYFNTLASFLKVAYQEGHIAQNPMAFIQSKNRIKAVEVERCYLVQEELALMMANNQVNEDVKRAFLFSCFSGIRISDIRTMTWENIVKMGDNTYFKKTIQKTQRPALFKLTLALNWLPERGDKAQSENVFSLPPLSTVEYILKKWAKASGVAKEISFHTARHTFATLMITLGNDLYMVSKVLGHKSIKVTEIYSKIIDKKRDEGMDKLYNAF